MLSVDSDMSSRMRSSSSLSDFLFFAFCTIMLTRSSSSSGRSFSIIRPSSWSSSASCVVIKLTRLTFVAISGLNFGLRSLVVM